MLNASVGMQRAIGRLRRPRRLGTDPATPLPPRSLPVAGAASALTELRARLHAAAHAAQLTPAHERRRVTNQAIRLDRVGIAGRLGSDRVVAVTVAAILLLASVISVSAGAITTSSAPIGGTNGAGRAPQIPVTGGAGLVADGAIDGPFGGPAGNDGVDETAPDGSTGGTGTTEAAAMTGPYLEDGTLLKPVAVDTTVQDGVDLLRTYKVRAGDTLSGIATRFKVSTMTLWWANKLDAKDELHIGQVLTIPPVSGVVVTVTSSDTLESLAAKYKISTQDIIQTNGLDDPHLVVGQVLILPGALDKPIPTPKPVKKPVIGPPRSGGGSTRPPVVYTGGVMLWPVVGGNNYISQYFHYGHWALDIAADYGSKVRAAAGGTVVFAGWKNNGGGYQVWIAHGSGVYTTYNHMSAITVGNGQHVERGHQVGRVGMTGNATGPHLHFEVWRGGEPWSGGTRVNPLAYF